MKVRMLARACVPLAAVAALAATTTLTPVSSTAAVSSAASGTVVQAPAALRAAAAAAPDSYTPKVGVLTNDPRSATKRRILRHILRSIRSVRHGETIRILSWNVASRTFVSDLLDANRRGVSVRLLMSKGKAMEQPKSGDFWRLKRGLRNRSDSHPQPKGMHSWARVCDRSCRGKRGIAHSKMFIFSRVDRARHVVMSTSANATEVSVNSQWNDLYTLTENEQVFDAFMKTFREASRDKPVRPAYRQVEGNSVMAYFYPWKGANARGDRVMRELKRITCRGAQGGTGINGRTRIRIAQDAIIDERGKDIAWVLRRLWNDGCNIKIVYALMGKQVRSILNRGARGPVPRRQIVQDFDGDGIYDRYLHSKVMAVSGRYHGDPSARVAWQGSENWSGLAKLSDEQGFRIHRAGAEGVYARWVDRLFANPPPINRATVLRARSMGVDPYALIKEELRG